MHITLIIIIVIVVSIAVIYLAAVICRQNLTELSKQTVAIFVLNKKFNKKFWEELIAFPFGTTLTAQKTTRPTIFLLLRVLVAAGTCLPSFCLAKIGCIHIHRHTD
jgi:hypothetical protein